MQGGACGEHPEGAVRTARVVTHSMKCVSSYYIHVGVSWILFYFHVYFTRTTRAAVCTPRPHTAHSSLCRGQRVIFGVTRTAVKKLTYAAIAAAPRSHARETHGEVGTAAHRAHGIEISGRLQEAREAHGMKAVAACRHERLAMLFARETICQTFLANAAVVVHRAVVDAVLGAAAALAGSTAGCPAVAAAAMVGVVGVVGVVGGVGVVGVASACNVAACGVFPSCRLSSSCTSFAAAANQATTARATATTTSAATTSAATATTASRHLGGHRAAATRVCALF